MREGGAEGDPERDGRRTLVNGGSLDCGGWKTSTLERGVPSGSLGGHVH